METEHWDLGTTTSESKCSQAYSTVSLDGQTDRPTKDPASIPSGARQGFKTRPVIGEGNRRPLVPVYRYTGRLDRYTGRFGW